MKTHEWYPSELVKNQSKIKVMRRQQGTGVHNPFCAILTWAYMHYQQTTLKLICASLGEGKIMKTHEWYPFGTGK